MKTILAAATIAASLVPFHAEAATGLLEVKVDAPAFVSGTKVIEFENRVPQTVIFGGSTGGKVDAHCALTKRVEVKVVAFRYDDGMVDAQAEITAVKTGPTNPALVSATSEQKACPSLHTEVIRVAALLDLQPKEVYRATDGQDLTISVGLTAR